MSDTMWDGFGGDTGLLGAETAYAQPVTAPTQPEGRPLQDGYVSELPANTFSQSSPDLHNLISGIAQVPSYLGFLATSDKELPLLASASDPLTLANSAMVEPSDAAKLSGTLAATPELSPGPGAWDTAKDWLKTIFGDGKNGADAATKNLVSMLLAGVAGMASNRIANKKLGIEQQNADTNRKLIDERVANSENARTSGQHLNVGLLGSQPAYRNLYAESLANRPTMGVK